MGRKMSDRGLESIYIPMPRIDPYDTRGKVGSGHLWDETTGAGLGRGAEAWAYVG